MIVLYVGRPGQYFSSIQKNKIQKYKKELLFSMFTTLNFLTRFEGSILAHIVYGNRKILAKRKEQVVYTIIIFSNLYKS